MQTQVVESYKQPIWVEGQEYTKLPEDLYIPPDALEVLLDSFSGPLDLLLYLIRKQNLDVMNIPIVSVAQQYLHYIELMKEKNLELASDYLVMAAMLAEIKSRMLLPKVINEEGEEVDPRAELVKRLQEYEEIREASMRLDELPRWERDVFQLILEPQDLKTTMPLPEIDLQDLLQAYFEVLQREDRLTHHQVKQEKFSVRDKMTRILLLLKDQSLLEFKELILLEEGIAGLVVNFLAILELARQSLLTITQRECYSPIYLQAAAHG